MSSALIEKIRKARQQVFEAGGFKFTVRRPTDLEMVSSSALGQSDVLRRFVIDWDGVKETDIIPGGTGDAVPFDTDLFMEWVADRPSLWAPLCAAAVDMYKAHQAKLEDSAKN